MKNLIISIALLLPIVVKSQDTIKIPTRTAKIIVKELISCDSLKAVHELTKEQLVLTEAQSSIKDDVISNYIEKEKLYEQRVKNEKEKFDVQGKWVEDLRKDNKKLKAKLLFTKITMSGIIAAITYLFITK